MHVYCVSAVLFESCGEYRVPDLEYKYYIANYAFGYHAVLVDNYVI